MLNPEKGFSNGRAMEEYQASAFAGVLAYSDIVSCLQQVILPPQLPLDIYPKSSETRV